MAKFSDIQLTASGDLLIKDGDIVIDFSDADHIIDIALTFPGEWKQFPLVGIGITAYEKMSNPRPRLMQAALEQYKADGYTCDPIIKIDANGKLNFNPQAVRK